MTARLLADIGGTHARFAWQFAPGAPLVDVRTLACAAYASLQQAVCAYLVSIGRRAPPECAIAIANPVLGDQVQMTNHHWGFSVAALRAAFRFERLRVLNDFTALALALPSLRLADMRQLGGTTAVPRKAMALVGPGTGLGVSGLLPDGRGGWVALDGEGGHVTLAATTAREHAVLDWLARRYGHVSAERAVCGQALVDIACALHELDKRLPAQPLQDPAAVVAAAQQAPGGVAAEAVRLFCAFLGTVAGNLALTLGARGGVYIGGGVVARLGPLLDASPFRERFESKGRMSAYLVPIPVWVIQTQESPALRGASVALDAPGWLDAT
jgi:glucokinase